MVVEMQFMLMTLEGGAGVEMGGAGGVGVGAGVEACVVEVVCGAIVVAALG